MMYVSHFFKTCARGRHIMGRETEEDAYEGRVIYGEEEEEMLIRKGAPKVE